MNGKIRKEKFITREIVQNNPLTVFVFGDNMQRKGFGGQAKVMRGELNTIGIPTKWKPNNNLESFFTDDDFLKVADIIDKEIDNIAEFLLLGYDVVLPEDGIGTGLASLEQKAPKIYNYLKNQLWHLEDEYK